MNFYDQLQAATTADRSIFLSIPLIQQTVQAGASRDLYVDFLTQAYHHVKHTYPLLALASVHTTDEPYQDALIDYMKEERLSLIHISEPTRRTPISYAVFC